MELYWTTPMLWKLGRSSFLPQMFFIFFGRYIRNKMSFVYGSSFLGFIQFQKFQKKVFTSQFSVYVFSSISFNQECYSSFKHLTTNFWDSSVIGFYLFYWFGFILKCRHQLFAFDIFLKLSQILCIQSVPVSVTIPVMWCIVILNLLCTEFIH